MHFSFMNAREKTPLKEKSKQTIVIAFISFSEVLTSSITVNLHFNINHTWMHVISTSKKNNKEFVHFLTVWFSSSIDDV